MNIPIEIDASIIYKPIDITELTFADNPQPRCPVTLLLDCSSSMTGAPIEELETAVGQFYREMASDPIASMSVEVSVITFGGAVTILRGFETIADTLNMPLPRLAACGNTPMGSAIELAMGELHQRRAFYCRQGLSAYKPWIVLLTDGQPNDHWQQPSTEARQIAEANQLTFMGIGIGEHVDMSILKQIVPAEPGAHRLHGLRFQNFFRWLSDSLSIVSTSSTIDQPGVPNFDDYDWKL